MYGYSRSIALRDLALVACLSILAGCGGEEKVEADPLSPPVASVAAAPSNLSATAADGAVSLSWATSTGATSYRVKRAASSGGPYVQVAAPSTTSHSDAALTNGTMYYYVVTAMNAAGESANSVQVSATPVAAATAPAAPAGLVAAPGNTQVTLTWSASSGATGYKVKRSTSSGGGYTQIATPASTTYTDTALTNGSNYYYVVAAVNAVGDSANSAQATASPAAATVTSMSGLHVSGNQILNGLNQAVSLRGVNKSGTEYMCLYGSQVFDGPSDAASVTVLKSWAINVVRIPVNEHCWLGINGVVAGGSAYQNAITSYVNLLTAANIAAIIDLQWSAPGTTLANALTPMPAADHAPAFWTSVANTFKSNTAVIFDLFNEPFPDGNQDTAAAWSCLKNGGTCAGVSYQAAGMQTLLNAVRATGSTNVVMVPGIQFTNTLTQWLANKPTDPANNLVAAWHSYANQICNTQACWDSVIKPVLQSIPVIVGEIGQNDCQDTYVNPLMAWLDANGGHYLAWAWNTYDCASFPALISSNDGTPTGFGIGIRDHFLAKVGQAAPPPPTVPFFSSTYPFGIAVGSTTQYTASDGTIYYPDVATPAMTLSMQFFTPFVVTDAITGTADATLYRKGRSGAFGTWTINVPNGNYQVTLGMAPNATFNAGEFGQDQSIQGQKVGNCVWSMYSGTNLSPGGSSCPQNPTAPAPATGVAKTITYTVSVFNQMLSIQPAASFGGGRTTVLNTIKVAKVP